MLKYLYLTERFCFWTSVKSSNDRHKWSLVTSFSRQYKQIKDIICRHLKVLKNDRFLGPVLPERAGVIYRGVQPLSGAIAPNVVDPPVKPIFFEHLMGYQLTITVKSVMCVFITSAADVSLKVLNPRSLPIIIK